MWDKNNFYRIGLSDAVKEDISGDLALLLANPNATINPEYSPYNQVKANPTGQDNDWR
jgi:hypothetical protein